MMKRNPIFSEGREPQVEKGSTPFNRATRVPNGYSSLLADRGWAFFRVLINCKQVISLEITRKVLVEFRHCRLSGVAFRGLRRYKGRVQGLRVFKVQAIKVGCSHITIS